MTTSPADFFSNPDIEIERDNGRPKIRPAGAPASAPLVPYTRASSLADYITDNRHIVRWQMRYLAIAMGQNPDLADLAAVETYSTGFDEPPRAEKTASGKRVDKIIERALDRKGIHQRADYGTVVHAATEPGAPRPPRRAQEDAAAFKRDLAEAGGQILATEVFTANDELQTAGTFDHLVRFPGLGVVILDKKTGRENPHEFGIQFSIYANAEIYNPETHERMALDELCSDLESVRDDVAIAAMIKDGRTRFVEIDIEKGYQGARVAAATRDYVESDGMSSDVTMAMMKRARQERDALAESVAAATDQANLNALWRGYRHLWTAEHTEIAKARIAYLSS